MERPSQHYWKGWKGGSLLQVRIATESHTFIVVYKLVFKSHIEYCILINKA